jgi:hypothetical protein
MLRIKGHRLDRGVLFEPTGQVDQPSVNQGRDRTRIGQYLADGQARLDLPDLTVDSH